MSEFATFRSNRRLGEFTTQVTVDESHSDDTTITDHPVEQGAAITDHAFMNPARLLLNVGWSDSMQSAEDVRAVYERLLKLQRDRKPFDVTTGKRLYQNMLIENLSTTTDQTTEHALMVTVALREVIIVETKTTTVPPKEVQAEPQKTAETTDSGTKQAVPAKNANQSLLKQVVGG